MTINGGQPHRTGDKGQRYEVRCKWNAALGIVDKAFDWCNDLISARSMVRSIDLPPSMHSPRIIDRTTNEEVLL